MATPFTYNVKAGKKGYSVAKYNYISRLEQYEDIAEHRSQSAADIAERNGQPVNAVDRVVRDEELLLCKSCNMPAWAKDDPAFFWAMDDKNERKGGSAFKEVTLALPNDMTNKQREALLVDFIQQRFGKRHPVSYAIHQVKASLGTNGELNTHAHVMYSERILDDYPRPPDQFFRRYNPKEPAKGGCKKYNPTEEIDTTKIANGEKLEALRDARKAVLVVERKLWADVLNHHFALGGFEERVSHESHAVRGIDKVPEKHLGWHGQRDTGERTALIVQRLLYAEEAEIILEQAQLAIEQRDGERELEILRDAVTQARRAISDPQASQIEATRVSKIDGLQLGLDFSENEQDIAFKVTPVVASGDDRMKALSRRTGELVDERLKNGTKLKPLLDYFIDHQKEEKINLSAAYNKIEKITPILESVLSRHYSADGLEKTNPIAMMELLDPSILQKMRDVRNFLADKTPRDDSVIDFITLLSNTAFTPVEQSFNRGVGSQFGNTTALAPEPKPQSGSDDLAPSLKPRPPY